MRVLVTGIRGQLGYDVVKELTHRGLEAVGVGREEMDITDAAAVERVITEAKVQAVIHCAAYNAVDKAEEDAENCRRGNVDGARNIAAVCKKLDIKMLYLSTDYVFDGSGSSAWTTEDEPKPLSVYGKSKYDAEQAVQELLTKFFIVRISWAFGINGNNFVKTMLRLSETRDHLSVVSDQIGAPTFTEDLAVLLVDMIQTEKYGIYHATNEGECSWYEFACEIFRMAGKKITVTPVTAEEYGAKAPRPQNSRLSKEKLTKNGFRRLPHWKNALERYLTQLGEVKEKKRYKARDVCSLVLLVLMTATLVFIWTNSMEAPAESSEKSQWVMKLLTPFLEMFVGKGNVTEFLVRKLAHFCEFGLLGCELSLILILRKRQTLQWYVNAIMFAFTVAALDETIQIFADRGSSLADVWLDTAGAVTGIIGVWVLYTLGDRIICRRRQKRSLRNVRAMRKTAGQNEVD